VTSEGSAFRRLCGVLAAAGVAAATAIALAASPATQAPRDASCAITTTERVVAVGDVHGGYEQFQAILRAAGLIDGRRRWTGGRAVFVQTGDVLDRGDESRQVLDLLRRLERDASRAGGQVHALLGNHETMRVLHDYRYVSDAEYAAFRSPGSPETRERMYEMVVVERRRQARAAGVEFDEKGFRTTFLEEVPLGLLEMRRAFGPAGDYGKWLRTLDVMTIINGIAFMHGGASPAVAALGCPAINAGARAELDTVTMSDPNVSESLIAGREGPVWYRGLVSEPAMSVEEIDGILQTLGVRAIVVGHTPAEGFRIAVRHGGRIFQIDTGMLGGEYYPGGVPSAIEFNKGVVTAIYEDSREVLIAAPPGQS
jgi:hypothetical protein